MMKRLSCHIKGLIAFGENCHDINGHLELVGLMSYSEQERCGVMLSKTGSCHIVRLNGVIRMEIDSSVTESLFLMERKLWM